MRQSCCVLNSSVVTVADAIELVANVKITSAHIVLSLAIGAAMLRDLASLPSASQSILTDPSPPPLLTLECHPASESEKEQPVPIAFLDPGIGCKTRIFTRHSNCGGSIPSNRTTL
jgi:hypothetical protein